MTRHRCGFVADVQSKQRLRTVQLLRSLSKVCWPPQWNTRFQIGNSGRDLASHRLVDLIAVAITPAGRPAGPRDRGS